MPSSSTPEEDVIVVQELAARNTSSRVYAQLDAGRREIKMLISSRADENEDMHRGGERGGRNARYVTPDLRYERGGAGEVGKM